MNSSPEAINKEQSASHEPLVSAAEQLEKVTKNQEASVELSPRDTEAQAQARAEKEAREKALAAATETETKEHKLKNKSSSRRGTIGKKERKASYKKTMKQVQQELPTSSRTFSKIIHLAPIEKVSDVVGATVARPNAILSGSLVAFILTLATYMTAKNIGYKLSGFETIAAFAIGWLIGILYDYFKALFTGKRF